MLEELFSWKSKTKDLHLRLSPYDFTKTLLWGHYLEHIKHHVNWWILATNLSSNVSVQIIHSFFFWHRSQGRQFLQIMKYLNGLPPLKVGFIFLSGWHHYLSLTLTTIQQNPHQVLCSSFCSQVASVPLNMHDIPWRIKICSWEMWWWL